MQPGQTHGTFQDILDIASPALRPVCESLRDLIASQHPAFVEVVWPNHRIASFGVGPKKMTHHYAYIAVQRSHVNLGFYHGASLTDPTGLLEGNGRKLRHVKIFDVSTVADSAIAVFCVKPSSREDRTHEMRPSFKPDSLEGVMHFGELIVASACSSGGSREAGKIKFCVLAACAAPTAAVPGCRAIEREIEVHDTLQAGPLSPRNAHAWRYDESASTWNNYTFAESRLPGFSPST